MFKRQKLQHKKIIYLLCALDVILLIGALWLAGQDYFKQILALLDPDVDRQLLKQIFREHGLKDAFFLLLITTTTSAVPMLSSSVFCIANGALFGPWLGFCLSLAGTSLGNLCMLLFFSKYDLPKRPEKLLTFLAEIKQYKVKTLGLLIGYMMPMFPSFVVNYVVVQLKIPLVNALGMVILGMVPTSFLYSFGGNAVFEGKIWRALGALLALAAFFLAVWFIKKRHQKLAQKD